MKEHIEIMIADSNISYWRGVIDLALTINVVLCLIILPISIFTDIHAFQLLFVQLAMVPVSYVAMLRTRRHRSRKVQLMDELITMLERDKQASDSSAQ